MKATLVIEFENGAMKELEIDAINAELLISFSLTLSCVVNAYVK